MGDFTPGDQVSHITYPNAFFYVFEFHNYSRILNTYVLSNITLQNILTKGIRVNELRLSKIYFITLNNCKSVILEKKTFTIERIFRAFDLYLN